ncbi:MAG: hypothetical protein ACW99G_04105 [Candidatus Thorarchaeota archaeon]|jgi:hypothetical protein
MSEENTEEVETEEIHLSREDLLSLALLQEKSRRIAAEKAQILSEEATTSREAADFTKALGEKYSIDDSQFSVDLMTGLVTPTG